MRIRDEETRQDVCEYWTDMGFKPIVSSSIFTMFKILFAESKGTVVVTGKRLERNMANLRGMRTAGARASIAAARRHLAFKDALALLAEKGVPVFFFNRVGLKKSGFVYSDSAARRMREGLNFPKMYNEPEKFETDLKELFGDKYSPQYVKEIGRIPQVVRKGTCYCHEDCSSRYVNVVGGLRVTTGQPERFSQTVHVYGRCGAFGYAVEDGDTLPSRMQAEFAARGHVDIRVVNHGLWGGGDDFLDDNFIHDALEMKNGDIVVFYRKHFEPYMIKTLEKFGLRYFDITEEWHRAPEATGCFYDRPGHMTAAGYRIAAGIVVSKMLESGLAPQKTDIPVPESFKAKHLTSYLKSFGGSDFSAGIMEYLKRVRGIAPDNGSHRNGAIVMNCNPFTNGHRGLIELAAARVDRLYVFVVEENRSFFAFEDRMEMVRRGVEDLANVVVVPSGKFVISSFTFPEYFMKDYVKERDFDVSSDIRTFCESIAPALGIHVRFAGEEPFDPVTKNYNVGMSKMLPQYGMEFCEIPRFTTGEGNVINATAVRRMLSERDFDGIASYVPQTTLDILRAKYNPSMQQQDSTPT